MIRKKETYSGQLLEVDLYPVNKAGRRVPSREPAPKKTKAEIEAQKRYEQRRAEKKLIRLINANFDKNDYLLTPTYRPECAPLDLERAEKDIRNYFGRIKRQRKRELKKVQRQLKALPRDDENLKDLRNELMRRRRTLKKEFKYVYNIERVVYKTGIYAGLPNYHFHIFMTGGLTESQVERQWHKGIKVNANTYKPDMFGAEAAARYLIKDPQGKHRYRRSRNLKEPKERIRDDAISKRHLARICRERVDDSEYWQRKYKGYRLVKTYPRYNPFNCEWYMSVILFKTDSDPPNWIYDDWS